MISPDITSASPTELLAILAGKDQLIEEKDRDLEIKQDQIDDLSSQVQRLQEQLKLAQQQRFGRSSEKFVPPDQGDLFNDEEMPEAEETVESNW